MRLARPQPPGAWVLLGAILLAATLAPLRAFSQDARVTGEEVAAAIQRGLANLRRHQGPDGSWADAGYRGGTTALCLLAMLNAGVSGDDPAIERGLVALQRVPDERTYVVSLKCQVYAAADPKKHARRLQAGAAWLANVQLANGMWNYGDRGRGDNSNTQFALLGLHEAADAGAKVWPAVWSRARGHFLNTQGGDGGWGYRGRTQSYGSMTAAAVASLYICGQRLHVGGPKVFRNGAYPSCGKYTQDVALAGGLRWLARNFSVDRNPIAGVAGRGRGWLYYYLYALERVGMISGQRYFGKHDWYRQGAAFLAAAQNADGNWGQKLYDTAFAILFLAKGNRPVLIQKIQWDGHWNRNIHDLENLTAFIGEKLDKPVTWQTTTLDVALAELRTGPILFLTGHEFPTFTDAQKRSLREFIESGGTLLAEACCGSDAFEAGFRKFVSEVLAEYSLQRLPANHPVFRSHYRIEDTYGLEGMNVGCRTGVFFSPNALSCLWELQDIPKLSEKAFRLGTNVAAYATGGQPLPERLDVVQLPAKLRHADQPVEVPRGAVRIARLIHRGDYNSDPHAMVNLAALLREKAKLDVVARARHLRATDEAIYEYPVIFMHGHFEPRLSDDEIDALRKYLQRGGLLFADACCGREAFDKGFRETVKRLFPDHPLELLPPDHPIYTGQVGLPLGELRYRQILAAELGSRGTTRPPLEAVRLDGRTVILYSKYDFSCALEGDNPFSCRGYVDADGRKLAINLALYGISY